MLNIIILGFWLSQVITELHPIDHLLKAVLNQGQGTRPMYQDAVYKAAVGTLWGLPKFSTVELLVP